MTEVHAECAMGFLTVLFLAKIDVEPKNTLLSHVFQIYALNQGTGGGDTSDPDATATVTGFPKSKTGTISRDTTETSAQTDITAVSILFKLQSVHFPD